MQCVNDFSGNVANGDVFWNGQISHTVAMRTRHEGQANGKDAPLSVQKYVEIRPKRCSEVYKVQKLYVGLLRELPPPSAVQDKWDQEVRRDLEEHLRQATSMLPKSMRDKEIITEPVLCMAGKKCSPTSVVVASSATCPKDPIALKPTVWIHCGSKKCKKKVLATIRNLAYLNHFLDRFCMEPPYVSLQAPWPAAGEHPSDAQLVGEKFPKISFAVQCPASGWTTVCGAKARFTIQTSDGIMECYSTLGGMVIVKNSVFGLTSAHAIVNYLLESSNRTSTDELESTDDCSSDSGSDHEISSDSGLETSPGSPCSSQRRTTSTSRPSAEVHRIHEVEEGIWVELQLPRILAYMGRGTISGDYSFPTPVPNMSDFALINLGTLRTLPNGFQDPVRETVTDILDFIPTSDLLGGEVWIIATCCDKPLVGYLLEGDASVILRGTVMRTKKIQVAFPGVPGLSGSWVVREGKLCGSIYAAYDRSPYLHMLPAESIFQDVAKLLTTSNIRVATPQDIRQRKSLTTHIASGESTKGEQGLVSGNATIPFLHGSFGGSASSSLRRLAIPFPLHLIPTTADSAASPPAATGPRGYDGANQDNTEQHMPPPPLAPVITLQNMNPNPTAIRSPRSASVVWPTSGRPGYVPRHMAPEPNKRALYVDGLDPRITEDVLRQIFETTGHVQSVKIIPDKNISFNPKGFNYGFVEFDDPGAAERAVQTFNGRRVHNNEIRVNWAYQSNNTAKEDTSNHFNILVGDLSEEVNDEVLLQAFSTFGPVSEARVKWDMKTGRSRGYGFVAFRDRGDAERALSSMDGEWLGSRAIRCNWTNQKGQPSISQQQAMVSMGMTPTTPFGHHHFPTHGVQSYDMVVQQTPQWQTTCYVGDLTPYTSQSDLVPLFQNFGYVTETRFQSDRGFAFIKMDTHENAAMAICQLNGYNVNGRPLKCSWGKDRPPTGQFEGYSPAGGPNAASSQTPSTYSPQYGAGPGSPMSSQGPSLVGQPFGQTQAGFDGSGLAQPYQQEGTGFTRRVL